MEEKENNELTIIADDGTEELFKILFFYDNPERDNKRFYFLYREETPGRSGRDVQHLHGRSKNLGGKEIIYSLLLPYCARIIQPRESETVKWQKIK